ncbi:excinuclease ABC subunit B [Alexandriicola marinus]|uniref:excinuclease ABC subunit B n=1 Tax=Alexandriicola marinus TaxID=2081710 RepID=UPI001EED078A|nr:excinuclease ABC subunit B [Alexandriicola marinus]
MKMMAAFLVLTLSTPASAWEFRAIPICTLDHATDQAQVRVTFDPSIPEYAIELTLTDRPWPDTSPFGIRFEGSRPNLIMTDRHALTDTGRTLTVRDSGFGNVLDGLAFNDVAIALIGDEAVAIPLDGAAEPVAAFRACIAAPSV